MDLFKLLFFLIIINNTRTAPLLNDYYNDYSENDDTLTKDDNFLKYKLVKSSGINNNEEMQSDQPLSTNPENILLNFSANFSNHHVNFSNIDYFRTMRNRQRENEPDERTKDNWIQVLKENILRQIGRSNLTISKSDAKLTAINITDIIPNFLNATIFDDDHITEKIRSYYPSCEIPLNTDQDIWKDDNIMNLYFDFDSFEKNPNIATATLRLYRIPTNTTKSVPKGDCEPNASAEEDRLLRVSIYWYTKSLRKRRVKRRLADSKVISENSRWVELSVKPATRAWAKGRNLGLAVLVEDQEGNTLRTDKYFKGVSCMVGASTPKPIPTIIIDAAREQQQTNDFNRIHSVFGGNTTSSTFSDLPMLPSIDICTLEFPENVTFLEAPSISTLRINACNLRKIHQHNQKILKRERLERLATLPDFLLPSTTHIRHQRQHLVTKNQQIDNDPRSKIIGKRIILTNEDFQNFDNFSTVDR